MALPVVVVTRPRVLEGQDNGRLPTSILFDTPGQAGGPTVRLVEPATRAWRALAAAAAAAGHVLKTTSLPDSYRSYEVQARVFQERYQPEPIAGRPRKWWNGEWWYQKYGTAPAATPGTSNHGWGLAADVGEERDGDTGTESMDTATLNWLVNHELDYGYSHELQSEPWHIRYWAGDSIPSAVRAYERGEETDMDTRQDALLYNASSIVAQMARMAETAPVKKPDGTFMAEPLALEMVLAIKRLEADMEAMKAQLAAGVPVSAQVSLNEAGVEQVRQIVDQENDEQSVGGADQGT